MSNHIKVKGVELCVFHDARFEQPLFESYEVAALLGYTQHSSLRKQTLTDWKGKLEEGLDYKKVHDEDILLEYDALFRKVRGIVLAPVKPKRGRLFFTPSGLLKVLNRSSKPTEELRAAVMRAGYFDNVRGDMIVKDEPKRARANQQAAAPKVRTPTPLRPLEDRKFEYEVMQKLIGQLQDLDEPHLRNLAISAAEVALGRKLEDLRKAEGISNTMEAMTTIFQATTAPKKPKLVGPVFTQDDYYSMTRIGELAGGFTAKTAGLAADIVASRHGYSREQIRNDELPINQIAMRPDSTSGKKRKMVRFHKDFANEVLQELRTNPRFEPSLTRGIPTPQAGPLDLGDGKSYPKLSRGPFETDQVS